MINIYQKVKILRDNKGFSLIELMIVVAILSFITIGLVTFFTGGARSWISGQNQLKAQREARMAMDRMVKEIREGKNVQSTSYESGLWVSLPAVLGGGTVSFELIGDSVIRNGNNILISNIPENGLTFYYFDDEGNPIADPTKASKLRINMQVDVDGDVGSGGNADIVLETEVNLRNYGIGG